MRTRTKVALGILLAFAGFFAIGFALPPVDDRQGQVQVITNADGTKHYFVNIQETLTAEDALD